MEEWEPNISLCKLGEIPSPGGQGRMYVHAGMSIRHFGIFGGGVVEFLRFNVKGD